VRKDLLLESLANVGKTYGGERSCTIAAAKCKDELIKLTDCGEDFARSGSDLVS
jgi:hypothetical protein